MANLSELTSEAAARCSEFHRQAEAVVNRLETVAEKIDGVSTRAESGWNEAMARARALISRAETARQEVESMQGTLDAESEQLASRIDALGDEAEAIGTEAANAVGTLGSRADALIPPVSEAFAEVERIIERVQTTTITINGQLESLVAEAGGVFRDEFDPSMEETERSLIQRGERLQNYVRQTFLPGVESERDGLIEQIEQIESKLDETMTSVHAALESDVERVSRELATSVEGRLKSIQETLDTIDGVIRRSTELLAETSGTVTEITQDMTRAMDSSTVGIRTSIDAVEEVIKLLDRVG